MTRCSPLCVHHVSLISANLLCTFPFVSLKVSLLVSLGQSSVQPFCTAITQSLLHQILTNNRLQVILDTIEYGALIKKTPVVVGNCTGFAVNRVFFPYTQAACMLVDLGLDPYMIDMVILKGFGMPMGPFR